MRSKPAAALSIVGSSAKSMRSSANPYVTSLIFSAVHCGYIENFVTVVNNSSMSHIIHRE